MDELEISGKRYISSRRAGKEHHYHPDYIGQLIRAHKIPGQKVGRSWYVDAEALNSYLYTKDEQKIPASIPATIPPRSMTTIPVSVLKEKEEIVDELFHKNSNSPAHIEERKVALHINRVSPEEKHTQTQVRTGLTYIADDAPLLPRIEKNTPRTMPTVVSHTPTPQLFSNRREMPKQKHFSVFSALLLGIVGTIGFTLGFSALVSQVSFNTYKNLSAQQVSFDSSYLASFIEAVKFN